MRAIINIASDRAAKAAGWGAKEVKVSGKNEASLIEILKATPLKDDSSMYELIAEKENLKDDWALFVDGSLIEGGYSIQKTIKDNVQIHVRDD
ncbi:MAG: hypothetical protein K9J79_09140 [Desulfobacteraceae bacterium]|nr:hypothetical protein [Desulfobacteraceae bacterium]